MEFRQRLVVACLWFAVAGVMALSLEPTMPSSGSEYARLGVIALALLLAVIYLTNPKGYVSKSRFE
ncbi:hypothetical protein [Natronobiforma cellulositropha]|uniref:hypothetical protein n=1 Tax=Natronobiforma cellulositropha TaxID=1679076 RepID=UPI0021D5813D|nr:hypothetical protein [Natronobiforma cellulositropha]